jgi:tRNA(fMet)-specific endonuclease VapC
LKYLLDTDTLSQLLKPEPHLILTRRLAVERQEDVFTSAITVGEIAYGAARKGRAAIEQRLQDLLDRVPVVSFDEASGHTYGSLRAAQERAGRNVAEPDLRIASIALTYDMVVITGNSRHFKLIDGLQLENWLT